MRKAAFLMAVLLLSAVWVVAQTTATGQAGTPTQSPFQNSSMQNSGTAQTPQTGTSTGQVPGSTQTGTTPGATAPAPNTQNNPPTSQTGTQPGAAPQTGAAPQAGAAAQTGTATQPAATGPQTTQEGCLSGTPGQYTLITKSGQEYALGGDDSLLGNNVGEQVRIIGSQSSGNAASGTSATPGTATGGTPYGATGTTASQPGATSQSQPGTPTGQTTPPAGQVGSSPGSAANSPAAAGSTPPGTPAVGSGPRIQVSNVEKLGGFCNMGQPH